MQEKQHTNFNHRTSTKLACVFASLAFTLIGALASADTASAASCDDSGIPCVAVSFGRPEGGSQSVNPSLAYYSSTKFYLPVEISLKNIATYTVKVYGSGSNLENGSYIIPSILATTSYDQLGAERSEWGIRWNFGDDILDNETASYNPIPASASDAGSVVVENEALEKSSSTIKKQLTLGFATAVKPDQESGEYTNTITVAVVASPREARSIFDIDYMQEMTTDICNNTTTPARTATTLFDTNAKHRGDANYIPETTLEDSRDGHTYLVRKLADGNCWMSQNLSLILTEDGAQGKDGTISLTNDNTDLNSKPSWTPGTTTQTTTGTAWGNTTDAGNNDQIHSSSYGWDQYWTGVTTGANFTANGNASFGGTAGYAQRGVYYNWFTATAGSGKSTDSYTTTDGERIQNGTVQDSLCPKGWTLPVGNTTNVNTTDGSVKSFYNLLQVYTGKTGNITNADTNTLYSSPMNFVPAGYYNYTNGVLDGVGDWQLYWSGTAGATADYAWYMGYYSRISTVYSGTNGNPKGHGFSIRCVSR